MFTLLQQWYFILGGGYEWCCGKPGGKRTHSAFCVFLFHLPLSGPLIRYQVFPITVDHGAIRSVWSYFIQRNALKYSNIFFFQGRIRQATRNSYIEEQDGSNDKLSACQKELWSLLRLNSTLSESLSRFRTILQRSNKS